MTKLRKPISIQWNRLSSCLWLNRRRHVLRLARLCRSCYRLVVPTGTWSTCCLTGSRLSKETYFVRKGDNSRR
jgi:hypothetical protein